MRKIFEYYLNKHGYIITSFTTMIEDGVLRMESVEASIYYGEEILN
ncbi:MAG: hypothetical protein J7L82_02605 [Staphylothermus sp.]|nr:hypothetical protein [Staphylothermus sp.]